MNIESLCQQGYLFEAINSLQYYLKQNPNDIVKRDLFQTLLCISGNLERADRQLELIAALDPKTEIFVHTQRQLLRAEKARHECFFEGRVPEFPNGITESLKLHLEALNIWRHHDTHETLKLLTQNIAAQPILNGEYNNKKFINFRDADDFCACVLEIYIPGGNYAWIDITHIATITTYPPKKLIDLIWQRAAITTHQGKSWEAYIPVIYPTTPISDEKGRLSQTTVWKNTGGIFTGSGQRIFLIDKKEVSQLEISKLNFQDVTL